MTKNKADKAKEKIRKVRVKESPSFKDDAYVDANAQKFYSGIECGHKMCGGKTECPECHRIKAIGHVEIRQRTGPVHLERMAKYDIMAFNKLPELERTDKTLKIYYL